MAGPLAAADLEVGRGLDPLAGFGMAEEQLRTQLDNVCSDPDATWTSSSRPILAPPGAGADGSILGDELDLPAVNSAFGGGSLEIRAEESGVELAGKTSPQLGLWRGGSGRWAIGFDPTASARVLMADRSLEAIEAGALADVPLSLHGGPASAHLLLLRSGWAAGEPFWLTARPERLQLAADASGIPLSDEALALHGGATFAVTFGKEARELAGRLGLGTASAWQSGLKPGAVVSLRARDAPGSELLAQLRAATELTYQFRAGGQFHVMIECFDRDLLSGTAEGRGLILRLRL